MNKLYYAAKSPRGFGNEIATYSFSSQSRRNDWVAAHKDDGGAHSAARGAYSITAREMRQICGCRGDAATESFNYTEPEFLG